MSSVMDSSLLAANLADPGCHLRTGDTSSDSGPLRDSY